MQGIEPLKRNQSFTLEKNCSAANKLSTLTICMENFNKICSNFFTKKMPTNPSKNNKTTHTRMHAHAHTHKQCVKDLWSLRCLHYKGRHDCIRQINHELKSQQSDWQNCLFFCWVASGGSFIRGAHFHGEDSCVFKTCAAKRLLRSISKGQHEWPLQSVSWFPNADVKVMERLKKK